MVILNLDGPSGRKSGKSLKVILGIGGLAAVVALASTLAANININSGPVEFGQGVAQTTACDDQITVTPYSTFINDSSTGSHRLTSIKIGGIDSSEDKCAGKTFVIKAYGDSGQLPLFNWETDEYDEITNPDREWRETERYDSVEVRNDVDEFTWTSGGTDNDDIFSETNNITDTSFTLNLVSRAYEVRRNPLALASDITKITVETRDTVYSGAYAYCTALGGVAGSQNCDVDSSATLDLSITIPDGYVLSLTGVLTITITEGTTLTNNGEIVIRGERAIIINNGTFINNDTIDSNGEINNNFTFNNYGEIYNNSPTGIINNNDSGVFNNDGQIFSNHVIRNDNIFNNNIGIDAVYLGIYGVTTNYCPYEWNGPNPTGSGQFLEDCSP
jgi:hypothetical protein